MRSTCGRPNRTAAAGTLWGARLRPWAMEEIGGDRWSRLGEVRRAAVKCQTAQPRLAQGPDGTVGFALRRTNGRTRVWNVGGKMGLGVLMAHGLAFARYRAGEMVLISTVAAFCLFGMAPFLLIMAGLMAYLLLSCLAQFSQARFLLELLMETVVWGVVLTCLAGDAGFWAPKGDANAVWFVPAGGQRITGVVIAVCLWGGLILPEVGGVQVQALTLVETTSVAKVEEVGDEEEQEVAATPGGAQVFLDFIPRVGARRQTTASYEAGRLRRRESAERQSKVFDPGRDQEGHFRSQERVRGVLLRGVARCRRAFTTL